MPKVEVFPVGRNPLTRRDHGPHYQAARLATERLDDYDAPGGTNYVNVSRGVHASIGICHVELFLGDEARARIGPIARMSEDDLRELLAAVGCEWAKKEDVR